MPTICARGKFNPTNPQRNVYEAELCRFTARRLGLICFLLTMSASTLLRAQEEGPIHVLPPGPPLSTTGAAGPLDLRSRVFVSAPGAAGSQVHSVLYAALKRSGEFQLVNDPAQANQIFEIHVVESEWYPSYNLGPDDSISLNILDNKGRFVRGPYTVEAKSARLHRNEQKNVRQAIDTLVRRISPEEIPAGIKLAVPGDEKIQPPVPAPFSHVKTVFISEVQDKTNSMKAKAPSEFYKLLCAEMRKWGRYKLLPAPEGADLRIDLAVSMHHGLEFKDPNFFPQAEVRMTMASSNLAYGYNMRLAWRLLLWPFGFKILTSQKDLQQSAEAIIDALHGFAASADAADISAKVDVQ